MDETSKRMGDFIRNRPGESESLEEATALAAAKKGTIEQALGIDAPITEEQAEKLGLEDGDFTPQGKVYRKPKRVSNKKLHNTVAELKKRLDKLEGSDNDK